MSQRTTTKPKKKTKCDVLPSFFSFGGCRVDTWNRNFWEGRMWRRKLHKRKQKNRHTNLSYFPCIFGWLDLVPPILRSKKRKVGLHLFLFCEFVVIPSDVLQRRFWCWDALRHPKTRRKNDHSAKKIKRKKFFATIEFLAIFFGRRVLTSETVFLETSELI